MNLDPRSLYLNTELGVVLTSPRLAEELKQTFATMIEDEKDHLAWVADWLKGRAGARACLDRYEAIDAAVYEELRPVESRLFDVPGLGQECDLVNSMGDAKN